MTIARSVAIIGGGIG
ncbi:unnamed protein product, partial [Rotaria sp. Silwood1]